MKKADKIARVVRWLADERWQVRTDCHGGYPDAVYTDAAPGWVVVATVDHDEAPEAEFYTHDQLAAWYYRAAAFRRQHRRESWGTAFWETAEA